MATKESHRQASEHYQNLSRTELQEMKLTLRDLAKTATVDELRERLIADHQQ